VLSRTRSAIFRLVGRVVVVLAVIFVLVAAFVVAAVLAAPAAAASAATGATASFFRWEGSWVSARNGLLEYELFIRALLHNDPGPVDVGRVVRDVGEVNGQGGVAISVQEWLTSGI